VEVRRTRAIESINYVGCARKPNQFRSRPSRARTKRRLPVCHAYRKNRRTDHCLRFENILGFACTMSSRESFRLKIRRNGGKPDVGTLRSRVCTRWRRKIPAQWLIVFIRDIQMDLSLKTGRFSFPLPRRRFACSHSFFRRSAINSLL